MVKKKVLKKIVKSRKPGSTAVSNFNPWTDALGRRLRVDHSALKAKLKIESNASINAIIEDGVRQFLGIGHNPPTKQMLNFLIEVGVVVSSAPSEDVQLIFS